MFRTLGLAITFLLFSQGAFALSPPCFVLQNQIKATLGVDRCVKVDDLSPVGHNFNLDIHVICRGEARAQALSDFVSTTHDFGGTDVMVRGHRLRIVKNAPAADRHSDLAPNNKRDQDNS